MKLNQRLGFPNLSIKLFQDYDAWLDNRFVELAATVTTLTIRDGLYGRNEGMLQFYDNKNIHTKMDGNQLIQISVANANTNRTLTRIYGCKHFAVSVDKKGDNILAINLSPPHITENLKFSRAFFTSAEETIQEMLGVIYQDRTRIIPPFNGINAYVPRVAWTSSIKDFMQYVREVGLAVESEEFVFVWHDFNGINMMDYQQMIAQEPLRFVVGAPETIGQFAQETETPLAFDFQWLTKANQHQRDPIRNMTFYSHSFLDSDIHRITNGNGENSAFISRSGGYSEMMFRNGYEEASRVTQMTQYDGYASCKLYGQFDITPGRKINFYDDKQQFRTDFYVDEVIHEISNNMAITNLYMFTNGSKLEPVEQIKVKNELKPDTSY